MKSLFTLTLIALTAFTLQSQTSLILQPGAEEGKDAWIGNYPSYINENFGDMIEFDAWAWTSGGVITNIRSLVEFDLSSIPEGSEIISAQLNLFYNPDTWFGGGVHSGVNNSVISRITEEWEEFEVTWNTRPDITGLNAVSIPATTSGTMDFHINVTAMVQDMVNDPEHSHGFQLRLKTEVAYRSLLFCSSDFPDASNHPKLQVLYNPPLKLSAEKIAEAQVSPNPFSESTTITFANDNGENYMFSLVDMNGKSVIEKNINSNSVIIEKDEIPSGIYFYNLISESGNKITGKIIAQ
ncbi:MAG: DNRLRE domain-containing protein [Chitinophagales bacterium]